MEPDSNTNPPLKSLVVPFQKKIPSKYWEIMAQFLDTYECILQKKHLNLSFYRSLFTRYATCTLKQLSSPFTFSSYHRGIRQPFNYYQMGLDLFHPLINFEQSTFSGKENLSSMQALLAQGENVLLFANHQTEADPQAICLLLGKEFSTFAQEMIFVAGERVVTDALAVPLSLGLNLFCVYSKKYFHIYPHRKTEMLSHNKQTMLQMSQQLDKGGKCIIIFPSGGRDRPDQNNVVNVAAFDPKSVELLYLIGKKSKVPTHYFPLALSTHNLLPPPEEIQTNLGENRPTNEAPIHLYFGKEISMERFPHFDITEKKKKKDLRAYYIWNLVCDMYHSFPTFA